MWGTPQKKAEATLKQALTQAPALRMPNPEKTFQLCIHEREGIALGVLTQWLGSEPQPVAYLSKRLDPTTWGWPPCLRNLAAIAIMIKDALKLSFGGKLTIFTSHQVKQLLNGRGNLWMSDQRILRYQVMLLENPGLTISPCEVLNPAIFLTTPEGSLPFHSCLETLDHWTKPWEELSKDLLTNPKEIWYTDGSSFVLDGKRRAGYAVVSILRPQRLSLCHQVAATTAKSLPSAPWGFSLPVWRTPKREHRSGTREPNSWTGS